MDRARFRFSKVGVDAAIERVEAELDTLARKCAQPEPIRLEQSVPAASRSSNPQETPADRRLASEGLRAAIPGLQENLRSKAQLHTTVENRYPLLLLEFYEWVTSEGVLGLSLSAADREGFLKRVHDKFQQKRLSRTDRVLILWLIQVVADRAGASLTENRTNPCPTTHTLWLMKLSGYDPLVLRLFCRLSRPPFNSVTLVGDLRQRLREDGGVVMWEDLGLAIPQERRARLLVNYRWAKATFEALQRLAGALELPDIELSTF